MRFRNPFKKKRVYNLGDFGEFGIIMNTSQAKMNGILDEHTKMIVLFKNGKIVEKIDYDPELAKILTDLEGIPIVEEEESDDFEFFSEGDFGRVIYRR